MQEESERKGLIEHTTSIVQSSNTNKSDKDDINLILYKERKKCSYYEYGNYAVKQLIYYCDVCDPNNLDKICHECLVKCHRNCGKTTEDNSFDEQENESQICGSFICECGKKRHELNETTEKKQEGACLFLQLDNKLLNKAIYSCEKCNCSVLCFICYLKCHGIKTNCITKKKITKNSNINEGQSCQCHHSNHSSLIILNKIMNSIFVSKHNYDTIPFVWKSQILNIIFDSSIYPILYEKAYTYIGSYTDLIFNESLIKDLTIDTFLRFVINVSKTKRFYYLNETLIKHFPFNNLVLLLNGFQNNHLYHQIQFVSGVMQLIYVLHLKHDFYSIKSFSYKDFFLSSVLDRIIMRKYLYTNSLYTELLHLKYKDIGNKLIIEVLCLDLIGIARRALDNFDSNSCIDFINGYIIIFQIIYFIIKRFILDKSALIKFIDLMEKFCIAFSKKINISSKFNQNNFLNLIDNDGIFHHQEDNDANFNDNNGNISDNITRLMFYITKILFVSSVNYNDFVVEDLIKSKGKVNQKQYFIHFSKNDQSLKVMKMISAISIPYCSYLLNSKGKNDQNYDYITFVNQTIELFGLSNNYYEVSLDLLTLQDYILYLKLITKGENRNKSESTLSISFQTCRNFPNDSLIDDLYRSLVINENAKNLNATIMKMVFNCKERIERLLFLYFSMAISYDILDNKYKEIIIEEFGKEVTQEEMFVQSDNIKRIAIGKNKPKTLPTTKTIYKKEVKSEMKNQVYTEIANKFIEKIITICGEQFKFIKMTVNNRNEKIEIIVEELIFASLDGTITKLFILDPIMKKYSNKTVILIFQLLSLFCLSKSGTKYLLMGKTISRLNEIFKVFPLETLNFMKLFSKAIFIYEINIANHQHIPILLQHVYKYIKANIQQTKMKETIIITMKILYNLSFNFEIDSLHKINLLIVEEIKLLINKEKVINLFPYQNLINNYNLLKQSKLHNHQIQSQKITNIFHTPLILKEHSSYHLKYIIDLFEKLKKNDNKIPTCNFQRKSLEIYDGQPNIICRNNKDKRSYDSSNISNSLKESISNISESSDNSQTSEDSTQNKLPEPIVFLLKERQFFFSLIKLLSNITYFFIMKNNLFNTIQEMNDLEFYQNLLMENYLTIKQRTTLLVFIRTVYINDQIDDNNHLILDKYLNSQSYSEVLTDLRLLYEDETMTVSYDLLEDIEVFAQIPKKEPILNRIKNQNGFIRLKNLHHLKQVIELFIHEIKNIVYYIFIENNEIKDITHYIEQLIYSVKLIGDVFITFDITSHLTLWFYEITKEFIVKSHIITNYFTIVQNKLMLTDLEISDYFNNTTCDMKKNTFDIYNTEKIYGFLLECLQEIYDSTNFNSEFKLDTFISHYIQNEDKNFKAFSLNKKEFSIHSFLQEKQVYIINPEILNNHCGDTLNNKENIESDQVQVSEDIKTYGKEYEYLIQIKKIYLNQFENFYQTGLYILFCTPSYDMSINYQEIFMNYCLVYIYNNKNNFRDGLISLLMLLNRLLTNEPFQIQKAISNMIKQKNEQLLLDGLYTNNMIEKYETIFFRNLSNKLKEYININIATSKNIVIPTRYEKINNTTKIFIQFFHLLAEGNNQDIHNYIISSSLMEKNYNQSISDKNTIFSLLCNTLSHIIKSFNLHENIALKGELPFDKMVIFIKNITDFIIVYYHRATLDKRKLMYESIKSLFINMKTFLSFSLINENKTQTSEYKKLFLQKRNVIFAIKIKLLDLISSLIEEGTANKPDFNILTDLLEYFNPIDLYDEIVKSFAYINMTIPELKNYSIEKQSIIPILLDQYKYNESFQTSIDLEWSLKVFYYMKIVCDVYDRTELKGFFDSLNKVYAKVFFDNDEKNNEKKERIIDCNTNKTNIIRGQRYSLKQKVLFDNNPNDINRELANYIIYQFLSQLLTRIEIKESNNETNKDFLFFVIPPICFLLSNQTMNYFESNVDRNSVHSKIINLIQETDYFIFEMFFNYQRFKDYSNLSKYLSKLQIMHFERINYGFILLQNLLLMIHHYSLEEIHPDLKYKITIYCFAVSIIQLIFIILVLSIWFLYIFGLVYRHNIMKRFEVKFIFRTNEEKTFHYETLSCSSAEILEKITLHLTILQKLQVLILDSIFFNRQINMLIFTFICIIIYILTGSAISLAVPVLFLANMNDLIYGIFVAVKLRWTQLLMVLCYTYIIVYVFSVFSFYYFTDSFYFEDIYNINTDNVIEGEVMCSSALQCYLTMLNYGVRNGGGIGDVLIKLAFNPSSQSYIARFFFDILFHIIIILIMTNLIFGIIVDSFASLRNKTAEILYDRMNVCFICQMTRDNAMNKNIDFDKHRETVHNMWNYVYFLTYLHINNSNNFKVLEATVWNKIHKLDTSWIPTNEIDEEQNQGKEIILFTDMIQTMKLVIIIKKEPQQSQDKMVNSIIKFIMFVHMNMWKENNSMNKKKIEIWFDQGSKFDIIYMKEYNEINEIIKKSEKTNMNIIKYNDNVPDDNNISNKNINMIALGPDDILDFKQYNF